MLWRKCEKLWSSKFIHAFWASNGSIKLKIADIDKIYIIIHNSDLEELFPGNELLLDSSVLVLLCLIYHWFLLGLCAILQLFSKFCCYYVFIFHKSYKSHWWSFTFFMCKVICIVLPSTRWKSSSKYENMFLFSNEVSAWS